MSLHVDIRKTLGDFVLETAFDAEDAVTGLLGASGCGKSMTLKCIAGVETPDSGCIVLDGETLFDSARGINLKPQQRRVGYLFQQYALFPHLTVERNILTGLHRERDAAVRQRRLREMIQMMQLQGLEKLRPAQLSGGQAQRVALARMLVNQPRLLLLDEPFSALDSHLRDQLQPQFLSLLRTYGRQAVLVTHSRDEAYHLCGQLCVMEDGRVVRDGTTKAVFADPRSETAARLTGCKNITPARKIDERTVEAPAWGLRFTAAQPVPDDLRAIGLRAHYFHARAAANRANVQWVGELEEPFEWILLFRYAGQDETAPPLWWRMPKDRKPAALPDVLGIAPENVLLLTR
ncbi:sulfate/molybdate ABC transporter ATP-binding protein [Agathobaculum sp. Marseille-P7918]|uniref:sulfate/molybdate ABC transporter ATP-binding protein n=1 Tax=Agathobaculum sp. Marseille-P7918 TaxID=2479843 RepID=UPI000F64035B|nr:ATP-binding cassette domain-containing protein [Agathobaculum sp. Marseille-P7918]